MEVAREQRLEDLGGVESAQLRPLHAVPDFQEVFRDNLAFVRRAVARAVGPSDADIDDLVQDVFLIAMDKLHTYDRRCRISTWLYGIAWRVASQHRRWRKVRSWLPLRDDESPHEGPAVNPEAEAAGQQSRREVYDILERLSEKKRQVLILYELEGYTGPEIAEIVGCKEATVWTRLHHARKDFRARALKRASTADLGFGARAAVSGGSQT